jgi:hypothetical protein
MFSVSDEATPTQLLSMIKEIDKFCPEEGLPANGYDLMALGTDDRLTTE